MPIGPMIGAFADEFEKIAEAGCHRMGTAAGRHVGAFLKRVGMRKHAGVAAKALFGSGVAVGVLGPKAVKNLHNDLLTGRAVRRQQAGQSY